MAEHTGTECINQADAPGNDAIRAMVGFESGSGPTATTTIYLVDDDGRAFTWRPGSTPVERRNTAHNYYALHGVSEGLLLAGGRTGGATGNQHIVEYVNGNLTVEPMAHTLAMTVQSNVNAVWMNAADVAFAVGDLSAVWRWNGAQGWTPLTPPAGGAVNMTSVAMPPNSRETLYVVDKGPIGTDGQPGNLYRKTRAGWARAPEIMRRNTSEASTFDAPLRDIAMTSVGEFWIVGDNGRVYHYPEQ